MLGAPKPGAADGKPRTILEVQKVAAEEPVADGAQGIAQARRQPQREGFTAGGEETEKQDFGVKREDCRGQECRAEQR